MPEMTAQDLIKRLRRMHGHVGAKDKVTVVAAIAAVTHLSLQLFKAENPHMVPTRGAFELKQVEQDEPDDSARQNGSLSG